MQTEMARINVTLPRDVIESLNHIAGHRSRSRLIAESLREYIRKLKAAELEKQLEKRVLRRGSRECSHDRRIRSCRSGGMG